MENFTQIENAIIKNSKIPDGAFRTYSVLKSFKYGSGNVFPSQKTIAELRGKSEKTIIEHLKILKKAGLISYKKRGFSASNQYFFINEENFTNGADISVKNFSTRVKKPSQLKLQKPQPNNTKIKNTQNKHREVMKRRLPELRANLARLLQEKSVK